MRQSNSHFDPTMPDAPAHPLVGAGARPEGKTFALGASTAAAGVGLVRAHAAIAGTFLFPSGFAWSPVAMALKLAHASHEEPHRRGGRP